MPATNYLTKERVLLFTLAAVQFTNIMDFMIMMPLGPQLMRIFDISPKEFSIIVSCYTVSAGICGFLSAFFIDKFDRKSVLLFSYAGFVAGTLACGLCPTYTYLLFARVLTGAFGGVLGALVLSIVSDAIPLDRRASAIGIVMAAFSFASVIGVPFGLYLSVAYGWNMPFLFLAFLGLIVFAFIFFFIPSMRGHLVKEKPNKNPFEFLLDIGKNTNQVMALMLMMFMMLSQFTYISMLGPFMVSNVGFTEDNLTLIYLIGGAFTLVSAPLTGLLADKFGRARVFVIFSILAFIPMLIITNLGHTELYLVLIVTSFNFIFITGRMIPGSTMITSTVLPQHRGSFMSINSSVQQLSSGLAAYIAGMVVVKNTAGQLENYNYVGYIALVCSVCSIYLALKIKAIDVKPKPAAPLVADHV